MTEIQESHVQWATVDRMRQMLHSTRRDFEITQTYTLFTGILCWVLQRVRWEDDDTDLRGKMANLRDELEKMSFKDFVRPISRPPLQEVTLSTSASQSPQFNDFSDLLESDRASMSALNGLVHLRNAVAHGDHRRVTPMNMDRLLLGYRIECVKRHEKKDPGTWAATVCLNRKGMVFIAEALANKFCKAALSETDAGDARTIRERRP